MAKGTAGEDENCSDLGGSDSAQAHGALTAAARIAQLELSLWERTQALAQAERELEAFTYSVSHDLKAPLRAVEGFSSILVEDYGGTLDATARDYLGRVQTGARRMAAMLEDLARLARIRRAPLYREEVDLSALSQRILKEHAVREPARHVEIDVEPGLRVFADAELMRTALEQLLANAWKFTAPRARASIRLSRLEIGGEICQRLCDNGVGFSMAYAERLFAPFQRLHKASEFEGHGIGLALVQRVLARHGGRIWVEAEPDAGACFTFTLGGRHEP